MRNFSFKLFGFVAGLVLCFAIGAHAEVKAQPKPDGSDPMPTCRCTATNNCGGKCGHVIDPATTSEASPQAFINDRELFPVRHVWGATDGGPIPMCPPKCPNCKYAGRCGNTLIEFY